MNDAALRSFVALIPACLPFAGAAIICLRRKSMSSFQLLGAAALVVVVLTHVFEAHRVFPRMRWGSQTSVGHYLDLLCAILGVTLFSLGYLIHACVEKKIRKRLALPETSLTDGFLEVRESKLDLNHEPHEVLVVTIEAR